LAESKTGNWIGITGEDRGSLSDQKSDKRLNLNFSEWKRTESEYWSTKLFRYNGASMEFSMPLPIFLGFGRDSLN
jgi:hypothetical protein